MKCSYEQNFPNSTTNYTDDTDIHEELSREIIGAAMEVLNELKPGLNEKLYEPAMIIELKHRGHIIIFVMSSGVETSLDFSR